jgi:HSP20 family protein
MTKKNLMKRRAHEGGLFPMSRFQSQMNKLFERMDKMWNEFGNWDLDTSFFYEIQPKTSFPKINVTEKDDGYDVDIAVAGFDKDDVELELKDNCLYIKADRKEEESVEDKRYLMKEIAHRSFRRTLRFPVKVDADGVSCKYENGIIKLSINKEKVEEKDPSVKIEIE